LELALSTIEERSSEIKGVQLSVRLPVSLLAELQDDAERNERSLGAVLRLAAKRYLATANGERAAA
jgi:predicted DNA-binding ribbon-helix-helix protein